MPSYSILALPQFYCFMYFSGWRYAHSAFLLNTFLSVSSVVIFISPCRVVVIHFQWEAPSPVIIWLNNLLDQQSWWEYSLLVYGGTILCFLAGIVFPSFSNWSALVLLFFVNVQLDLFTTLKTLGFLGAFLMFVGHRILSHLASTSAKLKSAWGNRKVVHLKRDEMIIWVCPWKNGTNPIL